MAKGSRGRGIRGELEVVDLIKAAGFEARRGQQFKGTGDSPDVIVPALMDYTHLEVKCVEGLLSKKMKDAYLKALDERQVGQTPVIIHRYLTRKGRSLAERRLAKRWLVTVDAKFFFAMMKKALG